VIVQLYVLDERFQLYCGINWCFMHQATIGLFGHLVKAVIYKVEITLRNDSYVQGKTREGDPKLFISMPAFDGVWTRLCRRLTHVCSELPMSVDCSLHLNMQRTSGMCLSTARARSLRAAWNCS